MGDINLENQALGFRRWALGCMAKHAPNKGFGMNPRA
jgi:hypothetical protein